MTPLLFTIKYSLSSQPPILQNSLPVLLHDVLKGPEEVFLEAEVGQLSFLQELHGELPQWVHSKDGYILIRVTAHLEGDATVINGAQLCITFVSCVYCMLMIEPAFIDFVRHLGAVQRAVNNISHDLDDMVTVYKINL